jgi:hypothetical protein
MTLADEAGTYEAEALHTFLSTPHVARPVAAARPLLTVPGLPVQAEVDRLLSSYEAWVEVDVALPDARPTAQPTLATLSYRRRHAMSARPEACLAQCQRSADMTRSADHLY